MKTKFVIYNLNAAQYYYENRYARFTHIFSMAKQFDSHAEAVTKIEEMINETPGNSIICFTIIPIYTK